MRTLMPCDMLRKVTEHGWSQSDIVRHLQNKGLKTNQGQISRILRGGDCRYQLGAAIRELYLDVISGDEVA